jgi:hypothetical protein
MLYRLVLFLARSAEFPAGSLRHGYEIVAPLNSMRHLDVHEWNDKRQNCCVRRSWDREPERHGFLRHRAGGAGGATWIIDYDPKATDDDEAGYRLDWHTFVTGEYVTIQDPRGPHTFRIASVVPEHLYSRPLFAPGALAGAGR